MSSVEVNLEKARAYNKVKKYEESKEIRINMLGIYTL